MINNILLDYMAEITPKGDLIIHGESEMKEAIKNLKQNELKRVRVVIVEDFEELSTKMINYYFGVLIPERIKAYESIGEITSPEYCDKELRIRYLRRPGFYFDKISDQPVVKTKSFSGRSGEVSNKEMIKYLELCIQDTAENFNYQIQFPKEWESGIDLNFER